MTEGLQGWIEIFRGGRQVDSKGREHDGDSVIDKALASFNTAEHEPPVVIGPPKENAPAFGWVQDLKADVIGGVKRLFAKLHQVDPQFKEMVTSGRFQKRSASFYADGRLRHVGFLGVAPPPITALLDVGFSEDDEAVTFEFGAAKEDNALAKNFTEADVKAAEERAAATAREEARKEAVAEFAEQQKARRAKAHQENIWKFCEQGVRSGIIPPPWIEGGLVEFMETLEAEEHIDFGEASGKKSPYAWFIEFVRELHKLVNLDEIAGLDRYLSGGRAAQENTN